MSSTAEPVIALEPELSAREFVALAQKIWARHYDLDAVAVALTRTLNITARSEGVLVGSVRLLTDGYFFGTVPELMVHPAWRRRGIGRLLMERAWEVSPTGLFFGAQPGREGFYEKLGYERSMASFARSKSVYRRPESDS